VEPTETDARPRADAARPVTELYQAHSLGLVRLAVIMLGDRGAAEDVVQARSSTGGCSAATGLARPGIAEYSTATGRLAGVVPVRGRDIQAVADQDGRRGAVGRDDRVLASSGSR
jgi:hypothetical protein